MPAYNQLYVHAVWATWDRLPLITATIAKPLFAMLATKTRELGCTPVAINGMPDHVHVLVEFTPTITIARLLGEIKGSSSHAVTHTLAPNTFFKWQGSYGAFTVSKQAVPRVRRYIDDQQLHHAQGSLLADYELAQIQL